MGVRNPGSDTRREHSKSHLDLIKRLMAGGPGYPGQIWVNREHGHAEP
jgi:hypothetical protein